MNGPEFVELGVVHVERELDVDLRSYNDRVRFVLLARIGAAHEAEPDPDRRAALTLPGLAKQLDMAPSRFRRAIDELDVEGDLETAGAFIAQVCEAIGDNVAVSFATRTVDVRPTPSWQMAASPSWWPELLDDPFATPLMAMVAARALEAHVRPFDGGRPVNTSTFASPQPGRGGDAYDPTEVTGTELFARRRLAAALLDAATQGSGHAREAQVMLERLCPVLLDEIVEFVERSPVWLPVAHVLDRALRSKFGGDAQERILERARRLVLGEGFLAKLRERQPRSAAALRLVRRVALNSQGDEAVRMAELLSVIALDPACARRARRYALWTLCEVEVDKGAPAITDLAESCLARSAGDEAMLDIVRALREYAGGYRRWLTAFEPLHRVSQWTEPFDVDLRSDGQLVWPLDPAVAAILMAHLGAVDEDAMYDKPWDRVPRRLVPGARRLVLEMLLHPGQVRTKAAADTLIQAGPVVAGAAARAICGMLRAHLETRAVPEALLEGAMAKLGYFRHEAALDTLLDVAGTAWVPADLRAAALVSVGDVLCHAGRGPNPKRLRSQRRALDTIERAVGDPDSAVTRAAMQAAVAAGCRELAPLIRRVRHAPGHHPSVARMAEWCLEAWQPVR